MQIDIQSKPRPGGRRLCPGSSQPVPSDRVNMNGQAAVLHTANCPACGERVDVWLSGPVGQPGQWIRDPHPEPVNAEHTAAIR
jgi:hypothetical protein